MRRLCWPAGISAIGLGILTGLSNLLFAASWVWADQELSHLAQDDSEPFGYWDALTSLGESEGEWMWILATDMIGGAFLVLTGMILLKLPSWIEGGWQPRE